MSKIAILYWEPGSCGDFVYSTLLSRPNEYRGVVDFSTVDNQGRVMPSLLTFFKDNFDHVPNNWYLRTWSNKDIDTLSAISLDSNGCLVIPTHRRDQVEFLQSHLNGATTIGITYPKNMFPLILKNWCKKVAEHDKDLEKIYNQPQHQYLRRKNKFGEFVLSEQLKFGSNIQSTVDNIFDVNLSLEDLYSNNLKTLKSLFLDHNHVDDMFCSWIKHQSIIHQYQYKIPAVLQSALGYNSIAQQTNTLNAELDSFDNILINHHNQTDQTAYFKTLQQAADFFKS